MGLDLDNSIYVKTDMNAGAGEIDVPDGARTSIKLALSTTTARTVPTSTSTTYFPGKCVSVPCMPGAQRATRWSR